MLQMQQTIQNQQQPAQEQAAVNAAREEHGLVQKSTFSGLTSDIPMDHIEAFERICNFSRSNGVPPDYVKCTLFPFSLEGKLLAGCNLSQPVFYDGVSYEFRNTLDSSSNGDFMTQTTPGAFALIENMASSSQNKNKEHDRSKSVNSIDDLTAKVDQLLKGNQSQVFIMEEATPEKSAVQLRSGKQLYEPEKRRFTTAEKGKHKESEQLPADTPSVERNTEPAVGTSSPGPEQPAEAVRPIPEVVPPREYIPKVPYPVPAKATRMDREEMKCRKMLEDLTVRLPLIGAIQMMPSMRSFMKGLISGKISEESEFMTVSKECSAVLQNRQRKKRGDPDKFVLSIQIGKTVFACSLVDLGSSVNLMPYYVSRRLGYTHFKPTKMSLVFVDRSVQSPVGILEDLQVKVGNTSVLADFVVLELEEESKDPLILGRPFLCTVGAIIDVRQGKIDLNLGDIVIQFEMDELLKEPMLDG
ncbi:PREDICTED: uncharacterized protein LOC106308564 [Brassica oleracea var. oleracea]|uniref:uncharacterized protein LOC106308564 n=1 Tax=Brassica oleracea var. oleracea TaxID=109376 RepID=UPI0006A6B1AD|nr:PREDICTED: uncharacterized protein LOC106308564 [Brassica oleracea var. oleracea]